MSVPETTPTAAAVGPFALRLQEIESRVDAASPEDVRYLLHTAYVLSAEPVQMIAMATLAATQLKLKSRAERNAQRGAADWPWLEAMRLRERLAEDFLRVTDQVR